MKKLLLLLLFPLLSFSQISYKDVMSISSADIFKKVAIENGYEFSQNDGDWVDYGLNIVKDSINGDKSPAWLYYNTKDDRFSLVFSRTSTNLFGVKENRNDGTYDYIVKDIKEKCKYYKIQNYKGTDFVTYSCSDSSYKGKIGFVINGDEGIIRHFPDN
jgi:hypothetical protein